MNVPQNAVETVASSTTRPANGMLRRFLREVWVSYIAHAELRMMMQMPAMTLIPIRSKSGL